MFERGGMFKKLTLEKQREREQFLVPRPDYNAIHVSLHTFKPRWSGDYEVDYEGYRPAAVPRDASYWEVQGEQITNKRSISFSPCSGKGGLVGGFGVNVFVGGKRALIAGEAQNGSVTSI